MCVCLHLHFLGLFLLRINAWNKRLMFVLCRHAVNATRVPKKARTSSVSLEVVSPQKVDGLRNRAKKSSIELAVELRAKRDTPSALVTFCSLLHISACDDLRRQRGSVVRMSVFGWRAYPALRPIYDWQVNVITYILGGDHRTADCGCMPKFMSTGLGCSIGCMPALCVT